MRGARGLHVLLIFVHRRIEAIVDIALGAMWQR